MNNCLYVHGWIYIYVWIISICISADIFSCTQMNIHKHAENRKYLILCDVPKWSITKDLNENLHPCDIIFLLISRFNEQYALFNLLKP